MKEIGEEIVNMNRYIDHNMSITFDMFIANNKMSCLQEKKKIHGRYKEKKLAARCLPSKPHNTEDWHQF